MLASGEMLSAAEELRKQPSSTTLKTCSKTSRSSGDYRQPFLPAEAVSQHQLVPGDTSDALDEDLVHGRARCNHFRQALASRWP